MQANIIQSIGQWIVDIFNAIVNGFNLIENIISNFIHSIGNFISTLEEGVVTIQGIIATMPTFLQVFCYWSISISLIYLIVGRSISE